MEEVKYATDNGNIVSYLLSKVSDLEASNKTLVDGSDALQAVIIVQDSKIDAILGLLQEKSTPMRQSKRSREEFSPPQRNSDGMQSAVIVCEPPSPVLSLNTTLCQASANALTLYVMRKGHKAQELFYDWYTYKRQDYISTCCSCSNYLLTHFS